MYKKIFYLSGIILAALPPFHTQCAGRKGQRSQSNKALPLRTAPKPSADVQQLQLNPHEAVYTNGYDASALYQNALRSEITLSGFTNQKALDVYQAYARQNTATWKQNKLNYMDKVLRAAFKDNKDLQDALRSTGRNLYIIDSKNQNDTYFGVNRTTKKGHNYIGQILEKIKATLPPANTTTQPTTQKKSWAQIPNALYFYNNGQPYYEFTNFYPAPFNLDHQVWPTSEHYYQAQKFNLNPTLQAYIRNAPTPREAFTRAQQNAQFVNPQWKNYNIENMKKALHAKFTQHPRLQELLQSTGDRTLVEASPVDPFYGYGPGPDHRGENKLGILLMELRTQLNGMQPQQQSTIQTQPRNTTTQTPGQPTAAHRKTFGEWLSSLWQSFVQTVRGK